MLYPSEPEQCGLHPSMPLLYLQRPGSALSYLGLFMAYVNEVWPQRLVTDPAATETLKAEKWVRRSGLSVKPTHM